MTKFFKLFQDTDFLTGLLTLAIASLSYAGIGDDMKDWVFPLMACYTLFSISAVFLIKSLIKFFQNNIEKNIVISFLLLVLASFKFSSDKNIFSSEICSINCLPFL